MFGWLVLSYSKKLSMVGFKQVEEGDCLPKQLRSLEGRFRFCSACVFLSVVCSCDTGKPQYL